MHRANDYERYLGFACYKNCPGCKQPLMQKDFGFGLTAFKDLFSTKPVTFIFFVCVI